MLICMTKETFACNKIHGTVNCIKDPTQSMARDSSSAYKSDQLTLFIQRSPQHGNKITQNL